MITATIPAIDSAIRGIKAANLMAGGTGYIQPNLAGYSQVPSMQLVATEHGLAISGGPGSSTTVGQALGKQLHWAQNNLSDFRQVIEDHESTMSRILRSINPLSGGDTSLAEVARTSGVFQRRPSFNAGSLAFAPVTISTEMGMDAQTLLSMFSATNDAVVAEAIAYWTNFASTMSTLASNLSSISSGLVASNQGEVFTAADSTMKGLAARAASIATASEVMAGHLQVLPSVKAMAVNSLSAIQAESKAIKNPIAQKGFEQGEVAAFLSGPYTAQLQTAIPRIPNLVSADAGSGVTSSASVGATVAGRSGTAQIGLSPTGMTGHVQTASAAPATTSAIPDSPTPMSHSTTPASASVSAQPAGTQSTIPTGPHAVSPGAPATSNVPNAVSAPNAAGATIPAQIRQMPIPTGTTNGPHAAPTQGSIPSRPSNVHMPSSGTTHAAIAPTATTADPNRFNGIGQQNMGSASRGATLASPSAIPPLGTGQLGMGPLGPYGSSGAGGAGSTGGSRVSPIGKFSGLPTLGNGIMATPGSANSSLSNGSNNAAQRGSGLMNTLANARGGSAGASGIVGTSSTATHGAAGASGAHAATAGNRGGSARGAAGKSARKVTNVATIRDNDAGAFEQNEYQRELFGDAPITIPAVIGHNVRG
ncbi:MAG: hypothetical protein Q4E11_02800 [Corynebacterium sp.]|uniref:hypothetical protein n=1 Tax=Corynebacterium sp. TaxID=1720 RepID=UPI0026DC3027|nr:hypothetical protein [Corynebacterium sp.]MDO5029497.1 hypothetical protein [Corynebacterium sp.]